MKAIILTYAPLQDFEKELIRKTGIYKIALNHHAKALLPDARIITDYVLEKIFRNCSEKIISIRDCLRYYSDRVEYSDIDFRGSTIVAAIEYLLSNNYDEIMIVGDNTVNSIQFQNEVKNEVDKLKKKAKIYQYSNGNFNLPVQDVKEFVLENKEKH